MVSLSKVLSCFVTNDTGPGHGTEGLQGSHWGHQTDVHSGKTSSF